MMSCLEFDDTRNDKRCIVNLLSKYTKNLWNNLEKREK